MLVRLGYVVELELLAGRVVGCEGTVRLITVGVFGVVVLVRDAPGVSVCVFVVGLVTVVVAGAVWFWRVRLLLDTGFSTFCGVTRLLLGEGVEGLLVGAEGVAVEEPPPPPLVAYWAAMLS